MSTSNLYVVSGDRAGLRLFPVSPTPTDVELELDVVLDAVSANNLLTGQSVTLVITAAPGAVVGGLIGGTSPQTGSPDGDQ